MDLKITRVITMMKKAIFLYPKPNHGVLIMKKHHLLILVLSIALTASADDSQLSVSVNTMSMDYTEFNQDGSFADSEKADALAGFNLNYTVRISDGYGEEDSFLDIDFSQYQGNTRYDGFYLDSLGNVTGPANNLTTKNTITDSSIGYSETRKLDQALWSVRIGMGYRLWERILADGHNEQYSWTYGSISSEISGNIFPNDNIGISAEYHRAFSPKMESNQHGTFDLGRTDGYSISVPWVHTITPTWAIKFAYTYQTWNIEHSTVHSDGWYEPRSESHFDIFNAAVMYFY